MINLVVYYIFIFLVNNLKLENMKSVESNRGLFNFKYSDFEKLYLKFVFYIY